MNPANENVDVQEVEDRFEEELGPTVRLKSGINLSDIRDGEVEFEISEQLEDETGGSDFDKRDVYKYMDQAAIGDEEDELQDGEPFEILSRKMTNVTEDGGVKKMILQEGTGGPVPKVAKVRFHFNAYCEYADEPFDSTYLRGFPKELELSSDEDEGIYNGLVGLCIGLRSMRKNEQARFLVSSKYAFGNVGVPPRVPAKATVLFQVELLSILQHDPGDYHSLTAREKKEAPFKVVVKAAEAEKEIGRDCFKQKRFDTAFRRFRRATNMMENTRLADDKDESEQQKLLLKLYLNCARCVLHLCQSRRALYYCKMAEGIDNNHPSCHYLRGKALRQQGDFEEAKTNFLKARKLRPADKDIARELKELEKKMQLMKLKDKQLYRRMFGQPADKVTDELKVTQNDNAIQTIAESFKQLIAGHLDDFLLDLKCIELPFSGNRFTPTELGCIAALAKERDLEVEEKGEGSNFHLKVMKRNPLQTISVSNSNTEKAVENSG